MSFWPKSDFHSSTFIQLILNASLGSSLVSVNEIQGVSTLIFFLRKYSWNHYININILINIINIKYSWLLAMGCSSLMTSSVLGLSLRRWLIPESPSIGRVGDFTCLGWLWGSVHFLYESLFSPNILGDFCPWLFLSWAGPSLFITLQMATSHGSVCSISGGANYFLPVMDAPKQMHLCSERAMATSHNSWKSKFMLLLSLFCMVSQTLSDISTSTNCSLSHLIVSPQLAGLPYLVSFLWISVSISCYCSCFQVAECLVQWVLNFCWEMQV